MEGGDQEKRQSGYSRESYVDQGSGFTSIKKSILTHPDKRRVEDQIRPHILLRMRRRVQRPLCNVHRMDA